MDLSKLFEMQRELDERIVREKGLDGQNLLPNKVLALQVELAELANEWRGFKFWSHDQVPRTRVLVNRTIDDIGFKYIGPEHIKNPLLEEYVDCLHFLLSIGLDENIGTLEWEQIEPWKRESIIDQFIDLFDCTVRLKTDITEYVVIWDYFIGLGEMLGFSWEEVEEAYMKKNAENHSRQESGY
ncbi:dUTPase [Anoxybacillus flavithermus]|uniref:dUTP diphosphatase n=2 Tax=Anoxybacillus flavithermus TaxID=33934 RepID=UPI001868AFB7|nr:dUTP diphosphatase [Anoxybacillus flavithermus]MBE2921305.1 dUTPase [Anoxybacillus flavithermus]MBE2923929.1 dUTPase [Anoxybacillus flavithermus]MBE2934978.1 dUTPase [Anoxybacillus flavithermus]MBE2949523.1 dUTPase [Anoxybacillus flavithermus]